MEAKGRKRNTACQRRVKAKKRWRSVVVETSVLVAGISGFKETYLRGKNPSADVLHDWAEERNFSWLVSEEILDEYKQLSNDSVFVLTSCRINPSWFENVQPI